MLASFGERSAFRGKGRASGGAASPGLGGQRTPRGKGKGKDMGITTYGLTRHSWGATSWEKVPYFSSKTYLFFRPRDPSKKLRQVLGISFLQVLALESFFKGEL